MKPVLLPTKKSFGGRMLIESTAHLPVSLAMFQSPFVTPDTTSIITFILRWMHIVAGITWIGLLYFFNLVNVPLQKGLDAETKKKVNPSLLSRTLWYFRWGAVVTVLVGLTYYAMYILGSEAKTAQVSSGMYLGIWVVIVLVTYAILFFIYRVPALTRDGRVLAVVISILTVLMAAAIIYFLSSAASPPDITGSRTYLGNRSLSIGVGGAMGIIMLLNVWGIIWPIQKRVIAAIVSGTPAPPPEVVRQAFLASRTNAWMSLPMLLFMIASHNLTWFGK